MSLRSAIFRTTDDLIQYTVQYMYSLLIAHSSMLACMQHLFLFESWHNQMYYTTAHKTQCTHIFYTNVWCIVTDCTFCWKKNNDEHMSGAGVIPFLHALHRDCCWDGYECSNIFVFVKRLCLVWNTINLHQVGQFVQKKNVRT